MNFKKAVFLQKILALSALRFYVFNKLILVAVIFSLLSIANTAYGRDVYYCDKPLYIYVQNLKKDHPTASDNQIIEILKNQLEKITPTFAKQKFNGLEWIDDDNCTKDNTHTTTSFTGDNSTTDSHELEPNKPKQKSMLSNTISSTSYSGTIDNVILVSKKKKKKCPALVVCFINKEVGYGLFTMEEIKEGDYITLYTGEDVTKKIASMYGKDAEYVARGSNFAIDAKYKGGTARFMQHFVNDKDLSQYGYVLNSSVQDQVATPNASITGKKSGYPTVIAAKDIEAFKQIGFYYSPYFGYKHSPWPVEPHLFDKDTGKIIPRNEYHTTWQGIVCFKRKSSEIASKKIAFIDREVPAFVLLEWIGLNFNFKLGICIIINTEEGTLIKPKNENNVLVTDEINEILDLLEEYFFHSRPMPSRISFSMDVVPKENTEEYFSKAFTKNKKALEEIKMRKEKEEHKKLEEGSQIFKRGETTTVLTPEEALHFLTPRERLNLIYEAIKSMHKHDREVRYRELGINQV